MCNGNRKVKSFIKEFSDFGKQVKKCFTNGNCYYFAEILKTRFNGEIMYAPIENHFICKIDNNVYDINGEYKPKEKLYRWRDYQRIEPLESKRIIKNCIMKV